MGSTHGHWREPKTELRKGTHKFTVTKPARLAIQLIVEVAPPEGWHHAAVRTLRLDAAGRRVHA